jgi:hypothetical protein
VDRQGLRIKNIKTGVTMLFLYLVMIFGFSSAAYSSDAASDSDIMEISALDCSREQIRLFKAFFARYVDPSDVAILSGELSDDLEEKFSFLSDACLDFTVERRESTRKWTSSLVFFFLCLVERVLSSGEGVAALDHAFLRWRESDDGRLFVEFFTERGFAELSKMIMNFSVERRCFASRTYTKDSRAVFRVLASVVIHMAPCKVEGGEDEYDTFLAHLIFCLPLIKRACGLFVNLEGVDSEAFSAVVRRAEICIRGFDWTSACSNPQVLCSRVFQNDCAVRSMYAKGFLMMPADMGPVYNQVHSSTKALVGCASFTREQKTLLSSNNSERYRRVYDELGEQALAHLKEAWGFERESLYAGQGITIMHEVLASFEGSPEACWPQMIKKMKQAGDSSSKHESVVSEMTMIDSLDDRSDRALQSFVSPYRQYLMKCYLREICKKLSVLQGDKSRRSEYESLCRLFAISNEKCPEDEAVAEIGFEADLAFQASVMKHRKEYEAGLLAVAGPKVEAKDVSDAAAGAGGASATAELPEEPTTESPEEPAAKPAKKNKARKRHSGKRR